MTGPACPEAVAVSIPLWSGIDRGEEWLVQQGVWPAGAGVRHQWFGTRGEGSNDDTLRRMPKFPVKYVGGCAWASVTAKPQNRGHMTAASDEVTCETNGP